MRVLLLTVLVALPACTESAKRAANEPDTILTRTDAETEKLEAAVAPFVAEARKTWPEAKKRYLVGLPKGEIFYVSMHIYADNTFEHGFLRVTSIKNGIINGTIANEMIELKTVKEGDAYSVKEADLYDWMIAKPDGSEEGNVVGKFIETYRP